MVATTKSWSGFLENTYREIMNLSMRSKELEYPNVMQVKPTTRNFERYKVYSGLGLPIRKPQLDPVQYDDMTEGPPVETEVFTEALGWKSSYENLEDNILGLGSQAASAIGDSLREGMEILAAENWNNCMAGDPTPILTYDGANVASATHGPIGPGGPTQSNLFTGDISFTLIQAFRYHFRNLRNDRGLRDTSHVLDTLIIAPDASTEPLLDQHLNAPMGQQPFTANYTPNELGEMSGRIKKRVYSYLLDTDRTIGLSNQALRKKMGPQFLIRQNPSTTSWDDDSIFGSCFVGSYRAGRHIPDWHGIVVSGG